MICQEIQGKMEQDQTNSRETAVVAPTVLLTETVRWPTVALLAVALAKTGGKVSAVCSGRHPLLKTRAVRKIFPYSSLHPLESLRAAIEATDPQIIIPCDDRAVQHLHELHALTRDLGTSGNKIAALIENSLGMPASYPIVYDRNEFLKIARAEGLRVPDTEPISTVADLRSWKMRHAFPCVLKADGTFCGHGVKIAQTLDQAERFLLELTRYYNAGRAVKRMCVNRDKFWLRPWWNGIKPAISVQSYIHGRPANCGVVCWKGKVLAGIGVEAVGTAGPTGPASVVRVVDNPDMMISAERIAGRLGLSGFFGLDFIIEAESGLTYLIEINPRPTRVSCFQLGKGRDPVGALCAQLSNQPFRERPPVTQQNIVAYFPDAWNPRSEFLASSFHDIPEGEPDLIQELLKPWPPKGLFWHLVNQMDRLKKFLRNSDSKRVPENQDKK
jgi:hypothetical protein